MRNFDKFNNFFKLNIDIPEGAHLCMVDNTLCILFTWKRILFTKGGYVYSNEYQGSFDVWLKQMGLIVDVKDNLYKILEGHQSTNKTLWDLITFTDNSEADNLLIGGNSPFTSNSSNSNFHFYLLDSIIGTNQPDNTAKLNVYKLFNKSHYDAQNDPIYVKDGTIVIACAKPTKLSNVSTVLNPYSLSRTGLVFTSIF